MHFAHLLDRHDIEADRKCISVGAKQPECMVSVISDTSGEITSHVNQVHHRNQGT